MHVSGDLSASGSKPFRIDHPLDPENKYLYHYALESPQVLNMYRGNVVLDASGEAWVELPDYFHAINKDFHYQLTCVGGFAPVHIAQEIENNRFKIAGGTPGLKVSWTVTGVRSDPYLERYGAPVEKLKPEDEQGRYLHPELYGMPVEARIGHVEPPASPEPNDMDRRMP